MRCIALRLAIRPVCLTLRAHSHVFTWLTGSVAASVSDTRCLLFCCVSPLLLCVGRRCSERGTCVSPVLLVHAVSNAGLHRFHCNGVCVVVQLCSQIYGVPQSTSSLRSCLTGVQLHRLTVFLSAIWFPCLCVCCGPGLCCCVLVLCCSGVGKGLLPVLMSHAGQRCRFRLLSSDDCCTSSGSNPQS